MSDQPNQRTESSNNGDQAQPEETLLWHAIRLDEFRAPKEPTSEAVRQTIRRTWQRIRHRGEQNPPIDEEVPELKSAPRSLLDRVVPTPTEIPGAAEGIAQLLDNHFADDRPNGPCLVLVVPPYHDIQPYIRAWAQANQVEVIEPPTPRDVMTQPIEWLDAHAPVDLDYVVIPELERYYLRHHRGLEVVRRWVEALWQTGQRCVITCDSWAWAFLEHVCPTNLLQPQPFVPAPFEAGELEQWIRDQVRQNYGAHVTFRRADDGKKAVRANLADKSPYSDEYLVHLAAYSRGNPIVAWSIWRDSLSIAVGNEVDEEDVKPSAQAEAAEDRGHTVWVRPWERVKRPALSGSVDNIRLFLLHALLLHRGLDLAHLQFVLTTPSAEIARHLQPLRSVGIVELDEDRWQVAAAAYPAVRGLLRQEGFLVDSL